VRFAVVGLGHIAQGAVLPAFAHAKNRAALTALVSDDPVKLRSLARRYGVEHTYSYDEYQDCLESGAIEAVYIALPNHLHRDFAVKAAETGRHVLVEKPMALKESDCRDMIRAAEENEVRLMVAYRLHFAPANLAAIEIAKSGKLGDLRYFNSSFSMQVKAGDIRLRKETGGGTLWDIGIYCINAARYLFRDEPVAGFAYRAHGDRERFDEVEEMTGAVLRFPRERVASFVTSFGAADCASYEIVGTKGSLRVENAYEYAEPARHVLTIGERTTRRSFPKTDQFAAELIEFSDCVRSGRNPEPGGLEGLIDVVTIRALYESAETGKTIDLNLPERESRPDGRQEIRRPAVAKEPDLVHSQDPTR